MAYNMWLSFSACLGGANVDVATNRLGRLANVNNNSLHETL